MRNWLNIDKVTIFKGVDENGNRYLSQFLRDYKNTFHPDTINAGCQRCLDDYYIEITKYLIKMGNVKVETAFVLKPKYNGIPLKFGSPETVTNTSMTDGKALYLIKNHKRGKELFDKLPDNVDELLNPTPEPTTAPKKRGRKPSKK